MKRREAKRLTVVYRHHVERDRSIRVITTHLEAVPRRIERMRRFFDDMHDRDPDGPFWDDRPRVTWRCRNKASAGRKRR